MDFPISTNPTLQSGQYTDGNPLTSIPPSNDDALTYNRIISSIKAVQAQRGIADTESGTNELLDGIIALIKSRGNKVVRVASTAAINLAAPGANIDGVAMVVGDSFLEKDHGTGSSRGIYIWNGAAVAATRATWADAGTELFSGVTIHVREGTVNADTNWQLTSPNTENPVIGTDALTFVQVGASSTTAAVSGAFKNLQASATGLSANVTVTADEVVVKGGSGQYKTLETVNLTVAGTANGANGLDTGALATNTWYSLWVIWNGATAAGLMSLSATAPTMPSGYTHKARIGWIKTDGTANKYPKAFKQNGKRVQYVIAAGTNLTAYPQMAAQTTGLPTTWTAVSISNDVPSTASEINGFVSSIATTNSANISVAPNNQSTAGSMPSYANPMPLHIDGNNTSASLPFSLAIEGTSIYWCGVGGTNSNVMGCTGWIDNI